MLNQHKILRVFQLITYLQEKPHKAVGQLATFLETTERTLMTRGMKGCFLWSSDEETQE